MGLYATSVTQIFDSVETVAGGSSESTVLDLTNLREDVMSVQLEVSGDGEATLAYEASVNGTDFMAFDGVSSSIKTGLNKTSGPGGDGKILINFTPKLAESIKFTLTETGGANSVTVSAWLITR